MRVTKEQAQESRRRIVEKAAALFRSRGFEGIGVADLMQAAGMTHGGFYRHFSSKDDLAREAVRAAYDQLEGNTVGKSVDALLTSYLSKEHRDDLATACPTSTLGGDAVRQPAGVQAVFAEGVGTWIGMIDEAIAAAAELNPAERRTMSIDLAARAVGALILSRAAAADPVLSDEILRTVLAQSLASVAGPNAHRAPSPAPAAA